MNKVFLYGNLGKDPEVTFLNSGSAVCKFPIATSRRFKKGEEWVEESTWHNIVVWGKRGETCGEKLRKGSTVLIEGRIQQRSWENKETGKKQYATDIVADQVTFASGYGKNDDSGSKRQSSRRRNDEPSEIPGDDGDLPF